MRSRAIVGLFMVSVAAPLALAHAPGVTHSYENGQPVITVRLVPDEAAVAKAKRIDALEPGTAHVAPTDDTGASGAEPVETLQPAANDSFDAPLVTEPANELPSAMNEQDPVASVSRYPTAKPALKPNTEIGVGGVLDLAPPAASETDQPRPMRLNSVQRPRSVADRSPPRQQRARPAPRARADAAPAAPAAIDPLDEALPSRIVMESEPASAMQLPPPKANERLAGGN